MSGLYFQLQAGARALETHGKAVEIAGKNLANINNPAYARQRVIQGQVGHYYTGVGYEGMGVQAVAIRQSRDPLLDRQVMRESSRTEALTAEQAMLQRGETSIGHSIDRSQSSGFIDDNAQSSAGGINAAMSDFFNAFESLAAKPTDVGIKQQLIARADLLSQRINDADTNLAQVQTDCTEQINQDLGKANVILQRIADLNLQIGRVENGLPAGAVDLRDERQSQLEDLAKIMDFEVRAKPDSEGQIQLVGRDSNNAEVLLVDGATKSGDVEFSVTNGFTYAGTAMNFHGGSIVGTYNASTGGIQDARDGLSALATQLRTSVNAAYDPSGTVQFFNTSSGLLSLNTAISVATLRAGSGAFAGTNDRALAVGSVSTSVFSTTNSGYIDGTLSGHLAGVVSRLGSTLALTGTKVEDQTISEQMVREQRDATSGVSQDEELADMLKYQRAFQASARYVNVVDELLDLVVNRLGV